MPDQIPVKIHGGYFRPNKPPNARLPSDFKPAKSVGLRQKSVWENTQLLMPFGLKYFEPLNVIRFLKLTELGSSRILSSSFIAWAIGHRNATVFVGKI